MSRLKQLARAILPRSVRNVLRAPGRALWWSMAETRHALGLDTTLQIRDRFVIRSHPAAYDLAYHLQFDDPEQVEEFDSFLGECDPGMRLLDIGAHFGLFSLAACQLGGPTARAVAVDASPWAARMVRVQALLNGVQDRIVVVGAAAGAEEGWIEMVAMGTDGAGYFLPGRRGIAEREMTRTRMTTVDALAAAHGMPTHVKIDVESFENEVLKGGRATFTSATPPKLFLEVHNEMVRDRGARAEESLELLDEYGYRVFDLNGRPRAREDVLHAPLTRLICLPAGHEPRQRPLRGPAR